MTGVENWEGESDKANINILPERKHKVIIIIMIIIIIHIYTTVVE